MDVRSGIINQFGQLLLANIELGVKVDGLAEQNRALQATVESQAKELAAAGACVAQVPNSPEQPAPRAARPRAR